MSIQMVGDKNERLTTRQQAEIVERCNEAYDKGGADVLKIVLDTSTNLLAENPNFASYHQYVQVLVEGIRAQLQDAVAEAQDKKEEEMPTPVILSPNGKLI